MLGITKDNLHSFKDFGVTIKSKKIGIASKNKITKTIPFMNGSYDFSLLYGNQVYDDRQLEYVFNLHSTDKVRLGIARNQLVDWLSSGQRQPLIDDEFPSYYFNAECTGISESQSGNFAEITATFIADPFMYGANYEGHDIWDIFNFEEDYAQQTSFTITNPTDTTIYNPSAISIAPTVICTSDMKVQMNDTTYSFVAGTTKDYRFKLAKGENHMTITGQGDIEFKFRKEVL